MKVFGIFQSNQFWGGLKSIIAKLSSQVQKARVHYENGKDILLVRIIILATYLVDRETPYSLSYQVNSSKELMAKRKNLGMVKIERIGQSACLLPSNTKSVHGRASETERVWVNNDDSTNLSWLKIQSILLGKPKSTEGIQQLDDRFSLFLFDSVDLHFKNI